MSKEYKFEAFDLKLLREARHQIDRVRNYNDGAPYASKVVKRLETILYKIDDLLEMGGSDNG